MTLLPGGNAVVRSMVWLGAGLLLAYLTTRPAATLLSFRGTPIGWLRVAVLIIGIGLHLWSNVTLARLEGGRGGVPRRFCGFAWAIVGATEP